MINKLISIGNFKVVLSVLILFLSTAIYPMDEKQESVNRVMSLIKETNARIEKDAQEIKKIENLDSIYIFLGLTGAGKSTIINFLANNKMMVRSNLGFRAIYVVDHTIEGIEIGNDVTSETKYPAYWYDQEKGIIYYDTPGLTDTGSSEITRAEAEIVNAYSIFKLFEILPRDKIKIVLVMTEGSINGRGAGMRDTIAIMGSYFKNHLKEVAQGTCIIVTKQNELTEPNQVLEVFRSVFANGRGTFTKESLLFLENLVSESKIVFFPKP